MFCDRCGTNIPENVNYCPNCGKAARVAAMPPPRSRLAGHIRLLGIFWLALSALHLIPGLFLLAFFRYSGSFLPPEVPGFVHGLVTSMGWVFLLVAAAGLFAGWGLLQREPWARTLAIVMGCFNLINMPFGTALGIYTLWVLLPAASEQEYRATSRAA